MSRQFRYTGEPGYLVAGFAQPHWVETDDVFEVPDEDGDSYAIPPRHDAEGNMIDPGLSNLYVEITPGAPTQSPDPNGTAANAPTDSTQTEPPEATQ